MQKRLGKILDEESKIMQKQFNEARGLTKHSYQQGYFFEEILRLFLKKYLPPSLDVARGFIIDSKDNISNELDIIIFDKNKTPIFFSAGDLRIIPIETALAVIEVKTTLDTTSLKKEIFPHLESINKLEKFALMNTTKYFGALETKKLESVYPKLKKYKSTENEFISLDVDKGFYISGEWKNKEWPLLYSVFSFTTKSSLAQLKNTINEYHQKNSLDATKRIDSVCVLGKGTLFHQEKKPEPQSKTKPIIPFATDTSELWVGRNGHKALKHYFGFLCDVLFQANIKGGIRYSSYYV